MSLLAGIIVGVTVGAVVFAAGSWYGVRLATRVFVNRAIEEAGGDSDIAAFNLRAIGLKV